MTHNQKLSAAARSNTVRLTKIAVKTAGEQGAGGRGESLKTPLPKTFSLLPCFCGQKSKILNRAVLEFDPTTRTLTYRSWANPEDFLVAQRTQGGWQYVGEKLTPEREKAISVDFERTLREREKAREKERDRGFER